MFCLLGCPVLNRRLLNCMLGLVMVGSLGHVACGATSLTKSAHVAITVSAQVLDTCSVSTRASTLGIGTGCMFGSSYRINDTMLPAGSGHTTNDGGTSVRRVTVTF
jgi:hypothetical protein